MKVFQYMASGKPIVASDHPMLREVLDEERAVLVPPGDVEAWVVAVSDLSADPDKCAGLGAAARREFEMKYTWRHRAERLLALVT
jgi:glycosyltransferase involved in cell wall biosynthesis